MSLNSGRKEYQIAAIVRAIEKYGPLTAHQVVGLARFKSGRTLNLSYKSANNLLRRNPQFTVYYTSYVGSETIMQYMLKSQ